MTLFYHVCKYLRLPIITVYAIFSDMAIAQADIAIMINLEFYVRAY